MTLASLQAKWLPQLAPEDFFLLLSQATGKDRVFLLAHPEYELSPSEEECATAYLKRRLNHEPVAYITSTKEFYGRNFQVTPATLIPRPETELLIEKILEYLGDKKDILWDLVDIGTGSGNIIITLAKEREKSNQGKSDTYFALDQSRGALMIAQENAHQENIEEHITFLESDLLTALPAPEKHHSLVVAANLPYLSEAIYEGSPLDVKHHEPKSALVSGADGLDHYRNLLQSLQERVSHYEGVTLFAEISPEQASLFPALLSSSFPQASFRIFPDLSGRERLVQAFLKE